MRAHAPTPAAVKRSDSRPGGEGQLLYPLVGLDGRSGGELLLADQHGRGDHAEGGDRSTDPERGVEARRERHRHLSPARAADPVCATATDERIAIPSAPPICCDVLIIPDASPASFGLDTGQGRDRDGHECEGHPDRDDQESRQQVDARTSLRPRPG